MGPHSPLRLLETKFRLNLVLLPRFLACIGIELKANDKLRHFNHFQGVGTQTYFFQHK